MTSLENICTFAQISDCHLFADKSAHHHGSNVYVNLVNVLRDIKGNKQIKFIVFTGDLTQDHQTSSYQCFVDAFDEVDINLPCYYLAGNHDDYDILNRTLVQTPFKSERVITWQNWQILLVDSKSKTPAGNVNQQQLQWLKKQSGFSTNQIVMMHHHPVDVGYFIDRHGLENKQEFWQTIDAAKQVKFIACGHVHQALKLLGQSIKTDVPVFTCPATSIQFDPLKATAASNGQGAGYRVFNLFADGRYSSNAILLSR